MSLGRTVAPQEYHVRMRQEIEAERCAPLTDAELEDMARTFGVRQKVALRLAEKHGRNPHLTGAALRSYTEPTAQEVAALRLAAHSYATELQRFTAWREAGQSLTLDDLTGLLEPGDLGDLADVLQRLAFLHQKAEREIGKLLPEGQPAYSACVQR